VTVHLTPPRFIRATDGVDVAMWLRNLTPRPVQGTLEIELETPETPTWNKAPVALPPSAPRFGTVPVATNRVGLVSVRATLRTDGGGDSERREFPVLPNGIEKSVGKTVELAEGTTTVALSVPKDAAPGSIACRVSVEPAFAEAVLAALPYLAAYPYGCTEQTMNRFVPVLAALEAVEALGVPRRGVAAQIPKMLDAGLSRLEALRHESGGFGWWPSDETDAGMTAIVVRGLTRAIPHLPEDSRAASMREAAAARLAAVVGEGAGLDLPTLALCALALAEAERLPEGLRERVVKAAQDPGASPLAQAYVLRALIVSQADRAAQAPFLTALERSAVREGRRGHWKAGGSGGEVGGMPARWQEDDVETTAEVLGALAEAGIEDDTGIFHGGAHWLLEARSGDGDRWASTRATAAAVAFLAARVAARGDLGEGTAVDVSLGGEPVGTASVTRDTLWTGGGIVTVPRNRLFPGQNVVLGLRSTAAGGTAAVTLSFFETGPAIEASDSGFKVTRRLFRLEPKKEDGRVTWTRVPVTETVPSGILLESELTITTPKSREYVMVLDPHAGGFEPEREVAMEVVGRAEATPAHVQRYDDRTGFFLSRMPAGTTVLRHLVRATHVGRFTWLPAQASLMYFPAVRGTSSGEALEVTETGSPPGEPPKEGGR
jgi:uncharacterized protein YfaS (alpha-2-macroglobulin family)